MTKDEGRRNDEINGVIRYTVTRLHRSNDLTLQRFIGLTRRSHSSSVIRHSSFQNGVTIIEMLVVIMIIFILAALVLAASSYVQNKGARARAETEIAAMSAALESYKADNGIYPMNNMTNNLDPTTPTPSSYQAACQYLYIQLSGDSDGNPTTTSGSDTKNYFGGALKPNMLKPNPPGANTYIRDPFGNSYGYSTAKASNPSASVGNNPTFDLWSTGGGTTSSEIPKWVKNW
jgi:general secretion pathway protein G